MVLNRLRFDVAPCDLDFHSSIGESERSQMREAVDNHVLSLPGPTISLLKQHLRQLRHPLRPVWVSRCDTQFIAHDGSASTTFTGAESMHDIAVPDLYDMMSEVTPILCVSASLTEDHTARRQFQRCVQHERRLSPPISPFMQDESSNNIGTLQSFCLGCGIVCSWVYMQGAGDDEESWAGGLRPGLFWRHSAALLGEEDDSAVNEYVNSDTEAHSID